MKKLIIFMVGLVVIGLIPVTIAQDEGAVCDYAAVAEELAEIVGGIAEADDPDAALLDLEKAVVAARIECGGMIFTSEEEGLQPVIGPVELPEGMYRATLTIDGMGVVELDVLDGSCGDSIGMPVFMVLDMGGAPDGAQTVVESEGCEALISFSSVTFAHNWTLEFEKLR